MLEVFNEPAAMTAWSLAEKRQGRTIGLVPTMGYLHNGHGSLMRQLRPKVDRLVVSIYVNPLQFGPNEDLETYPRDLDADLALCREASVDAVFAPGDIYPDGFCSSVSVHGLTERLCGASRPGHFDGVTTVCARLFGITRADRACFGEKDYQQLAVLRRMVHDLALPITIEGAALVRDEDGLALSSRNTYLSESERRRALSLHRAVFAIKGAFQSGVCDADALLHHGRRILDASFTDNDRLEYLEIVDAGSLAPLRIVTGPARALVAAYVGTTRLIDNVHVGPSWT